MSKLNFYLFVFAIFTTPHILSFKVEKKPESKSLRIKFKEKTIDLELVEEVYRQPWYSMGYALKKESGGLGWGYTVPGWHSHTFSQTRVQSTTEELVRNLALNLSDSHSWSTIEWDLPGEFASKISKPYILDKIKECCSKFSVVIEDDQEGSDSQ